MLKHYSCDSACNGVASSKPNCQCCHTLSTHTWEELVATKCNIHFQAAASL